MGHEDALLLDRLDRHEPHRRTLYGFADRFGIERVALAALHIRLHVGRRDQANLVPHRGERACPVMRSSAGLHTDQTRVLIATEQCPEGQLIDRADRGRPPCFLADHAHSLVAEQGKALEEIVRPDV